MNGNYEKILERIVKSSEVGKEELERRVEAKRAKLSGLISKEGALQIIAAELGISFENEKLKINELLPGMRKTDLFIRPEYKFRIVDCLITNFHLPRSTNLVLAGTFLGKELLKKAYYKAVEDGFRFYSFGDAMLAV